MYRIILDGNLYAAPLGENPQVGIHRSGLGDTR